MGKDKSIGKPLYDDNQIRIDYYLPSMEEHALCIKERKGDETQFILQRGVLEELAKTPRGGLTAKLDAINPTLQYHTKKEEISLDGLHVALCQAYIEEERRYSESR